MTQKQFAKLIGFSESHWFQVLRGTRNLKWRNAKKVAKEIGGDPNLWREGRTKTERKKVWREYQRKHEGKN